MENVGALISRRLDELGMSKAEFGRRINKSRQSVNDLLKRTTVDLEYLNEIGNVLDYDFFQHYTKVDPSQTLFREASLDYKKSVRQKVIISVELDGTEETVNRWVRLLPELNKVMRLKMG